MKTDFKTLLIVVLSILIACTLSYLGCAIYASNWNSFVWVENVKITFYVASFWGSVITYNIITD